MLKKTASVYGLDLEYDETRVPNPSHYKRGTAEDFDFPMKFDAIIAADLIEHLTNPGQLLDACARNLKPDGRLIITTPNCFNPFNLASKITKTEPTMNKDETCYFNHRSLRQLLRKKGWQVLEADYLYTLEVTFRESMRKRLLNVLYWGLSKFTPKFIETVVVIAKPVVSGKSKP